MKNKTKRHFKLTYHIYIGYNPHFGDREVWEELKRTVFYLRSKTNMIVKEAVRIEGDTAVLYKAALRYKDENNLTLQIVEHSPEYPKGYCRAEPCQIMQTISCGGYRNIWWPAKKRVCRAFCRLVMKEMHKKDMEINILVV